MGDRRAAHLVMLAALFLPSISNAVMVAGVVCIPVATIAYSYIIWRTDPDARKNVAGTGVRGR